MPNATVFLPPEKAAPDVVARQARLLAQSAVADALDRIPVLAVVLNRQRQIVYCHPGLPQLLRRDDGAELIGLRLGEAIGCIHPQDCGETCGSTRFCRFCGAARAIRSGLRGVAATLECLITRRVGGVLDSLTVQAWAAPLRLGDEAFVQASLLDINHEKRLRLMELFFYHDLLNTASGIRGLCHLLRQDLDNRFHPDMDTLINAAESLIDQIRFQKDLTKAERRELILEVGLTQSLDVLRDAVEFYRRLPLARDKMIETDPDSRSVSLRTDRSLLLRCLNNLIKNALEASGPGDAIIVGCHLLPGGEAGARFSVHSAAVLAEAVRLQIFKRAFTTKGPGRGLGSYSVKLFVENNLGGRVWLESTPEAGTTFHIDVPSLPDLPA